MANVKKVGDKTEQKCLDLLQKKGYWCHLMAYNKNGQPCDIVAIKKNFGYLIDVKHCEGDRFEFRRIEPNQRSCFDYNLQLGNHNLGFMIYYEKYERFNFVPYVYIKSLEIAGQKSIKFDERRVV